MLNRNAEALFWIGRYIERAENHARLVDVHYHLREDQTSKDSTSGLMNPREIACKWARVVNAIGNCAAYEQKYGSYRERDVLLYITLDRDNPNSLVSCISHARNNLRTLREQVPTELWDTVNGFYLWLRERRPDDLLNESPHLFFKRVKEWTALFMGISQSVMPRENEWHFMECGRFLERMENTLRILQSVRNNMPESGWNSSEIYPYLLAVLKSVSGYQLFRHYHADRMAVDTIMKFVVLNPVFPRSIHFALHEMDGHLKSIDLQEKQLRVAHDRIIRQIGKVKADLAYMEREDFMLDMEKDMVAQFLEASRQLGLAIANTFFRLGEVSA